MQELRNAFDKTRSTLDSEIPAKLAIVTVGVVDGNSIRQLTNSTNVFSSLKEMITAATYNVETKKYLTDLVNEISSKIMLNQAYDLLFAIAKTLEMNTAYEIFSFMIDQIMMKYGDIRADSSQTEIVKNYFDIQPNQTIFSGRIGKGIEITELLDGETNIPVFAQDFAHSDLALAEVRLHLAGCSQIEVKYSNILTSPEFVGKTFDYIHDCPRFGYKHNPKEIEQLKYDERYQYFGAPSRANADLGYVVAGIHSLNETGKAAYYLTTGALSRSGADEKIRERLVSSDLIEAVVEFPSGFFAPATGIPSVLLLINKAKSSVSKGNILFINTSTLTESSRKKTTLSNEGLKEVLMILNERKELKGISKVINTSQLFDYELVPSRYVFDNSMKLDSYGLVKVDLNELDKINTVPLAKMATIFRGYNALPKDEDPNGNVALLKIADIIDGEIQEDNLTRYKLGGRVKLDSYRLQKGDIVLSIRGVIKTAMFESMKDDVLLSQNFIGIRCNQDFDPAFLKLYLESPTMQFIMNNKLTGSTVLNLSLKDIEEFRIPKLPIATQREIAAQYNKQQEELRLKYEQVLEEIKQSKLIAYKEMGISTTFDIE